MSGYAQETDWKPPMIGYDALNSLLKKYAPSAKEAYDYLVIFRMMPYIDAVHFHSRRPRRAYFGELEQMDVSPYEWFGAEKTALHIAVDDATGAITGARFDSQETLKGYYGVYAARHI